MSVCLRAHELLSRCKNRIDLLVPCRGVGFSWLGGSLIEFDLLDSRALSPDVLAVRRVVRLGNAVVQATALHTSLMVWADRARALGGGCSRLIAVGADRGLRGACRFSYGCGGR